MSVALQVDLIGSDGRVYRFLAKPKDDLRKDNRMMEVASILNGLFAKDPASRRRNLLIRRSASFSFVCVCVCVWSVSVSVFLCICLSLVSFLTMLARKETKKELHLSVSLE